MAENLPINFAVPGENVISSYSWTDVANGLGYINFYGIGGKTQAGNTYHLINNLFYGAKIHSSYGTVVENGSITLDTSSFNSARILKGTAYFQCGHQHSSAGDGYVKIQLFKVDLSSNEIAISSEISSGSTGTSAGEMAFVEVPITTEVNIKVGEKIRAKVTLVKSSGNHYMGLSPIDVTFTGGLSQLMTIQRLTLSIPFKIEI